MVRIEDVDDADYDLPLLPEAGRHPASPQIINAKDQNFNYKNWEMIYPCYFDVSRSAKQGRRVPKQLAVSNPLAQVVVDACKEIGLPCVFEPMKTHPQDWSNPGRARVQSASAPHIKNKRHMLRLISEYLQRHPTSRETPLSLRLPGLDPPSKAPQPPSKPRGQHIVDYLPLHSPAVSGGGISQNLMKDMMSEMQQEQGGAPSVPQVSAKKSKKR